MKAVLAGCGGRKGEEGKSLILLPKGNLGHLLFERREERGS